MLKTHCNVPWGTAGIDYSCIKKFHDFTLYVCFVINTEVAMGLHVDNMFVNMEATPIKAAETTAHVMSLGKEITRTDFATQVELQMLVMFPKTMAKNEITTQIFQQTEANFLIIKSIELEV